MDLLPLCILPNYNLAKKMQIQNIKQQLKYTRAYWNIIFSALRSCTACILRTVIHFHYIFWFFCLTFSISFYPQNKPNIRRKAKKINITCMHWMLKYECEDITHQRSNRWCKTCCYQTTLKGDHTSSSLSTVEHASIRTTRTVCTTVSMLM